MSESLTRTSMALDTWTVQALRYLSEKWSIPKAEVIRRAVRQLKARAEVEEQTIDPLQALESLQNGGCLLSDDSSKFLAEVVGGRETG